MLYFERSEKKANDRNASTERPVQSRPSSKLLSFLPPAQPLTPNTCEKADSSLSKEQNLLNAIAAPTYNKHEPLVVHSETNIEDNEETFRSHLLLPISNQDREKTTQTLAPQTYDEKLISSRFKFTTHLDQCNHSLVKLVNMMNNNNLLDTSILPPPPPPPPQQHVTSSVENYPHLDETQIYNDVTYNEVMNTNQFIEDDAQNEVFK